MIAAKLAAMNAKIFVKQHPRQIAFLYILIQINGLALYAAAVIVGMLTGNIYAYYAGLCIASFCSFIAACKLTERVKNKLFSQYAGTMNRFGLSIAGILYVIVQMLVFFDQNPYLTGMISAANFLINVIFLPFYLYPLFTEQGSTKSILKNACRLLQKRGLDFFKLLIRFIPLYLLSALIARLPVYCLINQSFFSGMNLFQLNMLAAAATAAASIIGVVPMYTETKLYTAIFYLFSDLTE